MLFLLSTENIFSLIVIINLPFKFWQMCAGTQQNQVIAGKESIDILDSQKDSTPFYAFLELSLSSVSYE